MKTATLEGLAEMHARYDRKGNADPLYMCIEAARAGHLYEVDTQHDGADALIVADDEDTALADIATHFCCGDEEPSAEWARARRWTATRIELS